MLYQFHRWIISLGAQVHVLHRNLSQGDMKTLKRDAERYEAELQQLYAYAEQQDIDLIKHYHPFADIEEHLLLIHKHLVSSIPDYPE